MVFEEGRNSSCKFMSLLLVSSVVVAQLPLSSAPVLTRYSMHCPYARLPHK